MVLLRLHVAVVGEPTVGKSAFVQMVHSGGVTFPKNYLMTMGCELVVKEIVVSEENSVEVFLFDIAGQKVYETLAPVYLENKSAFLLLYDVSEKITLDGAKKWADRVRQQNKDAVGYLVANKMDLADKAEVTDGQGEAFARNNGLKMFQCSSLRGTGINVPIEQLSEQYVEKYEQRMRQMEMAGKE